MNIVPQDALVPFQGTHLPARKMNDQIWVGVKPICEHLGIAYQGQHKKLAEEGKFNCQLMLMVAEDGRQREMLVIERRDLAGWLYGISTKKVGQGRPDHERQQLTALLTAYQRESTDALNVYWTERQAATPQMGGYLIPQSLSEALRLAADLAGQNERTQAENAALRPRAEAFDHLMETDGTFLVGSVAQIIGTGEVRLFKLLRERSVLKNGGEEHNLPYQKYLDARYFEVKLGTRPGSGGTERITRVTRVTVKGLAWIRKNIVEQALLPLHLPQTTVKTLEARV